MKATQKSFITTYRFSPPERQEIIHYYQSNRNCNCSARTIMKGKERLMKDSIYTRKKLDKRDVLSQSKKFGTLSWSTNWSASLDPQETFTKTLKTSGYCIQARQLLLETDEAYHVFFLGSQKELGGESRVVVTHCFR